MIMQQGDWYREVEVAADWWVERISEATAKAFPQSTLFGVMGRKIATPETLDAFRSRLIEEMNKHLLYMEDAGKGWDRSIPLRNATYRKFGKEGGFVHPAIQEAAKVTGFEEVLPSIPEGCMAVVSPGTVFAAKDRKHRGDTFAVAYRPPDRVMETVGDGI
jgi:hypothetical protein